MVDRARWDTRKRHEGTEGELRCAPAAWLWCSRHSERPPVMKSLTIIQLHELAQQPSLDAGVGRVHQR